MYKKKNFHLKTSSRHTITHQKSFQEKQKFFLLLALRGSASTSFMKSKPRFVQRFSSSSDFANSNSFKIQEKAPIQFFSGCYATFEDENTQSLNLGISVSQWVESQGRKSFCKGPRFNDLKPNQDEQNLQRRNLPAESANWAPPPISEISDPTLSNLRSRNILGFLFAIIIGAENSNKTVSVNGSFFSFDSRTKGGGFDTNILTKIAQKSKKVLWSSSSSRRNMMWGGVTILTILGFPVLLGFTMRFTNSQLIQPNFHSTSAREGGLLPTSAIEQKSQLFHGLLPSPKFVLSSFSNLNSTDTEANSTIAHFKFHFLGASIEPVRENILRLPEYLSKLFIIWGLLSIWKGVRPQRKTLKDFHGDGIARVIWPNRPSGGLRRFLRDARGQGENPKGAFSSLQGLTAFLPVLETLIQSLQIRNFKLLPLSQEGGKALTQLSGRHPKGYLFVGPPGTGKTLLAQALASEAQVPLLCLSASEIQKQIEIGTRIGALRLRKLFDQARRLAPCILFLDEIDAIGKYRGGITENGSQNSGESSSSQNHNSGSGKSSDLKLFTEFLIQMDECKGPGSPNGFVVIGTTNFLSNLDSAFIRSGRFDRILGLNYPAKKVRVDILKWYCGETNNSNTRGAKYSQENNLEIAWNYFGHYTDQYSPADLARLVNESLLYQVTKGKLSSRRANQIHSFESLQKGFNRIQSHKKDLSGEGKPSSQKQRRDYAVKICKTSY